MHTDKTGPNRDLYTHIQVWIMICTDTGKSKSWSTGTNTNRSKSWSVHTHWNPNHDWHKHKQVQIMICTHTDKSKSYLYKHGQVQIMIYARTNKSKPWSVQEQTSPNHDLYTHRLVQIMNSAEVLLDSKTGNVWHDLTFQRCEDHVWSWWSCAWVCRSDCTQPWQPVAQNKSNYWETVSKSWCLVSQE